MRADVLARVVNRRHFLAGAGTLLGVGTLPGFTGVCSAGEAAMSWPIPRKSLLRKGDVLLFQGDSITDAGRSRENAGRANDQAALGSGYAWLAAASLLVNQAGPGLRIYNRGISGNKVYQLAERWDTDCLDLKPNVLSILIGVNDFWHTVDGHYTGTVERYEKDYRALLRRTRQALPEVKLVICEPFVLRCGAVKDQWFPEFDRYRATAQRVARAFKAPFVPFQTMFNEAVKYAPADYWAKDGVHPTPAGAALMAQTWLRLVAGRD